MPTKSNKLLTHTSTNKTKINNGILVAAVCVGAVFLATEAFAVTDTKIAIENYSIVIKKGVMGMLLFFSALSAMIRRSAGPLIPGTFLCMTIEQAPQIAHKINAALNSN
jgi:hypothetical protein